MNLSFVEAVVTKRIFSAVALNKLYYHFHYPLFCPQLALLFNKSLPEYQTNKPKLDETLDLLETFLGISQNVAGEKMTVADLALLASVSTVEAAGMLDKGKWPKISGWLTRLQTELPYYSVNVEGSNMLGGALKRSLAEISA